MPYILVLYVTGLLLANVTGGKVMSMGPLILSVGALAYPLTFVLQDVINELYGKEVASVFVKSTALSLMCLIGFSAISVPIDDAFNSEMTSSYRMVLGGAPRIVFASMIAFYVGGLIDVQVFFRARKRWPDSLLTRKMCSTLVSQFFDSLIFVTIGFAGVMSLHSLFVMALSQYVVKQVIAVCGLPITYSIIHRLR